MANPALSDQDYSIIDYARESCIQERMPQAAHGISDRTKCSQAIIRAWQDQCCKKYPFLTRGNPTSSALAFALHDHQSNVVYELKPTATNPRTPLFKAVCKAIAFNKRADCLRKQRLTEEQNSGQKGSEDKKEQKVETVIFIYPQAGWHKLQGEIPKYLGQGKTAGFEIILKEI